MSEHLPILQIVIPLISAPVCLLLRRRWLSWGFALTISSIALVISAILLSRVYTDGAITYELGGWAPPWGIEYRIDILNAFVLLLVTIISTVVLLYSPDSAAKEIPPSRHHLFYTAYLLCLTGLLGVTITGDAFNLFVFLEISALSSYILISLGTDRRALTASYQYLVMGTLGATFIVIGIGLLYVVTGTLNMADIAGRLAEVGSNRTVLVAFAFLTVGMSLKLALFPLHLWLPNAYAYAPSVVTAFLASTATKVSIYVFLRFVFTIFGRDFAFETMHLNAILMPLALIGIFVGSIVAIFQTNIKRMLAYSSVAQIGYMMLGISFLSVTGLTGGIVHLFNHGVMKGALFLAVGCVVLRTGSANIEDFRGLGKRMPITMTAFVLSGVSLIGVPLTVGFVSKWYLVLAALEQGLWPVAVLILLASLLAVAYIWRIVEVAYFQESPEDAPEVKEAPFLMQVGMWTLIVATYYFGISTTMTVSVARKAAEMLIGGST
jgi:multicomponent Na+:H+ antiporter subunit D